MSLNKHKLTPITVSVGIPAYNAEENIAALLTSLETQKEVGFLLKSIIVYDDVSHDKTRQIVNSYPSSRVTLVSAQTRRGFAHAVHSLLTTSDADVMVILNDDVLIEGTHFFQKTIEPFITSSKVGLLCANPQPYQAQTFVERAVETGFRTFEKVKLRIRQGNNSLTCDGKTMHFSRAFIQSIPFPKDYSEMGNVDTFMYCICKENGFDYRFVRDAVVRFKNPSTIRDLVKWTLRNNDSMNKLRVRFGSVLESDLTRANAYFTKQKLAAFAQNPFGCLLLMGVTAYVSLVLQFSPTRFNTTWETVRSTKHVSPIVAQISNDRSDKRHP